MKSDLTHTLKNNLALLLGILRNIWRSAQDGRTQLFAEQIIQQMVKAQKLLFFLKFRNLVSGDTDDVIKTADLFIFTINKNFISLIQRNFSSQTNVSFQISESFFEALQGLVSDPRTNKVEEARSITEYPEMGNAKLPQPSNLQDRNKNKNSKRQTRDTSSPAIYASELEFEYCFMSFLTNPFSSFSSSLNLATEVAGLQFFRQGTFPEESTHIFKFSNYTHTHTQV